MKLKQIKNFNKKVRFSL